MCRARIEIFKQFVRETGMPVLKATVTCRNHGVRPCLLCGFFGLFVCLEILTQQENMGCSGGMKCRDSEAKLP